MNDRSGTRATASGAGSEFLLRESSSSRGVSREWMIYSFWMAALIAVFVMARSGPAGWDAQGYWQTVQTVHHNNDPYAEGLAALQDYHQRVATDPSTKHPFAYVYSPLTLPLVRLLGRLPAGVLMFLYWIGIAIGALLQLWAGFQMAAEKERRWLALALPAIVFFPGLITDDVILSGNIAYILYGAILVAATRGWKRGHWGWYYAVVIAASIVKTPLLAFLLFPVLTDRRQRVPASLSAAVGLGLFTLQMKLWPEMFREYLTSVRFVFEWLHDFGFSPASVLGRGLALHGLPTTTPTTILYFVSASVIGIVLLFLSSRVAAWKITRQQWVPVAFVGTALLNPRIMKYDLAAITVPLLLIAVRGLRGWGQSRFAKNSFVADGSWKASNRMALVAGLGVLLASNIITVVGPAWVPVEVLTLLAAFTMGLWFVYHSRVAVGSTEPAVLRPIRVDAADAEREEIVSVK